MVTVDSSDTTCGVFGSIKGAQPGTILRFLVGEDATPRPLTTAEIDAELRDPFATLLLRKGVFPATADELLASIDAVVRPDDLIGSSSQKSFILGEGSQLRADPPDDSSTNRNLRFLVSRGSASDGPELILSAADPRQGLVELMAWDPVAKGFNYYRNLGNSGEWVFAGNSRHALSAPTKGKGPFESHPSGNLLMKELKLPWVHWHSFKVDIFGGAFPAGDLRRQHAWFTNRKGAEVCEPAVVMPSIVRWTSARFDQVIAANGEVSNPGRVVEQIVTSPTVNLTSSTRESAATAGSPALDLPPTFFVDADGLGIVGLPGPPPLEVSRELYASSLETFDFVLSDGTGFEQRGDTHFAFTVPERAFEDNETLRQAIQRGLISDRLGAALLMVDFPNPVFSSRRAQLLRLAPERATITDRASTFSEEMAQRILGAAPSTPDGSAEREFADLWAAGDNWRDTFGTVLAFYYEAIQGLLASQVGFDAYIRLAEARRNRVRQMPIFESPLLFAQTNIAPENLVMDRNGTVKAGT